MERLHMHRPGSGATYYEAEEQVIRGPLDSYSSEYRVEEYANPGYPLGHRRNAEYVDKVTEVRYETNPGYSHHLHHPHGGVAEIVERREETIFENAYDPYKRHY